MIDLLCLLEFYNTYEHGNVFFDTSEKMVQNFEAIGHMGTQELADYLFISTSTLYRFVKMMAYDNHNQMKFSQQMFLEQYMHGGRYLPKQSTNNGSLKEYGSYLARRIESLADEIQEEELEELVHLILAADNIIFIGMPMPSVVWRLQIELILLGKRTNAFLNPGYQMEAVKNADSNSLIFMIQYMPENSGFYLEVAKEAKRQQIPTAAISNIPISPTLNYVDRPVSFEGALIESDMLLIETLLNVIGNKLHQHVIENKRCNRHPNL